jgi:membrane protein implicated in regulation of membrane protease activity
MLGAEAVVQTEFWLAVIGAAAIAMGLALSLGIDAPVWAQWAAFAVLAVAFNVGFRRRIYAKLVGGVPGIGDALDGESGVALERIEPGAVGPVELRGSSWRARNVGERAIEARAAVRVEGRRGILLDVR